MGQLCWRQPQQRSYCAEGSVAVNAEGSAAGTKQLRATSLEEIEGVEAELHAWGECALALCARATQQRSGGREVPPRES